MPILQVSLMGYGIGFLQIYERIACSKRHFPQINCILGHDRLAGSVEGVRNLPKA